MKHYNLKLFLISLVLGTGIFFTSCKGKSDKSDNETTVTAPVDTPTTAADAPVVIAADDSLKTGVKDATKDFPGVKADVNNGEITLTGQVERSRLPTLMQSLQSLRPKKINNNLTIK
nr:Unknown Function [uncultured bacterium]